MPLKKVHGVLPALVLAVGALATAPAAHAEDVPGGFGGISGWQPPTEVCGTANIVPLLFANYTNETQTGVIQVDGNLSEQVVIDPWQGPVCPERDGTGRWAQNGSNYSQDITVAPGQVGAYTISLGGVDENLIGSTKTFTMSGTQSGHPAYSFTLDLSATESFKSLQAAYEGTGGTDLTNGQNGFNILSCSPVMPAAGDNVTVTGPINSPYSEAVADGPTYSSGDALCLGWLPEGQMITSEATVEGVSGDNPPVRSVVAAQYNSSTQTVGAVLEAHEDVGNVQVVGPNGSGITLTSTPGSSGGFWSQADTGRVFIEGLNAYAETQLLITGSGDAGGNVSLVTIPTGGPEAPIRLSPSYSPSDISVKPSSEILKQGVIPVATVTGAEGLDAIVDVNLRFNLDALSRQPDLMVDSNTYNVTLVSATDPSGATRSYSTYVGSFGNGGTLGPDSTPQVYLPAATSEQNLLLGKFLTGTYTSTYEVTQSVAAGETPPPPVLSFTIDWDVAAPEDAQG